MRLPTFIIACLVPSILSACAGNDTGMKQEPLLPPSPGKADIGAEAMMHWTFVLSRAVHSTFGRVKDDVRANEYVLFDEISRSFEQGIVPNDHVVQNVAEEILEQMLMTDRPELAADSYGLVSRLVELLAIPRESVPPRRLGQYLDDSIKVASEMLVLLEWNDGEEDKKEPAYYFAAAYNVVVATHIFALAEAGYSRETIESSIRDAITTNEHLVGGGATNEPGFLLDWVAAQTPGSASNAVKLDRDPVLFGIRHILEDQRRALE